MRTIGAVSAVISVGLLAIASTVAVSGASDDMSAPFDQVTGTLSVHQPTSQGNWSVVDGIQRHREFPIAASGMTFTDSRLNGELKSAWNWDVHPSGQEPVPSWGTITLNGTDGGWEGSFTGIRRVGGGPIDIRAALTGMGMNQDMCSMLDILATGTDTGDTWIVDGVIYPC